MNTITSAMQNECLSSDDTSKKYNRMAIGKTRYFTIDTQIVSYFTKNVCDR